MRWVLSGLSFALMVGLAVATAGIKTSNVNTRLRLDKLAREVLALHVELARRQAHAQRVNRRELLEARWRAWLEAAARRS